MTGVVRDKPVFLVFGAGECWNWHLVTPNGVIVAMSPHPYSRARDARRAILNSVVESIFFADIQVEK